MERWLSWSKAHDWKSCVGHKPTEGSNPSLSARTGQALGACPVFVCKEGTMKKAFAKRPSFAVKLCLTAALLLAAVTACFFIFGVSRA